MSFAAFIDRSAFVTGLGIGRQDSRDNADSWTHPTVQRMEIKIIKLRNVSDAMFEILRQVQESIGGRARDLLA
jgi:hypothetical protein